MATPQDIAMVRRNTNEPTTESYTDDEIGDYVDAAGVSVATVIIWRQKAATYAELVDVSEAGASRKFSDLHKHALSMADEFEPKADGTTPGATTARAKVHKIVRS